MFDPSAICSGLCLFKVSFYDNLIFSTSGLIVALAIIGCAYYNRPQSRGFFLQLAVYLLLFAYPLVSAKVVGAFGCHQVSMHDNPEGTWYLRADYAQVCYDSRWKAMAAYASFFLVTYVAGMPIFILFILLRYRKHLMGREEPPKAWLFRFLLDDYKLTSPAILWEFVEIIRKLLLSVIGSFWSSKSAMAIATALLISTTFLILQHHYQPFKDRICNQVAQMEMQCLCLAYFAGLLIKVGVPEAANQDAMGRLLMTTVVLMLLSVLGAVLLHTYGVVTNIQRAKHCGVVLKGLPQCDPAADTDSFYLVQGPVEKGNCGSSFKPKLPHLLSSISDVDKLQVIHSLSGENEILLEAFFGRLQASWTIPLQRMLKPHQVDDYGKICLRSSWKTDESILAKANRPSIRRENPAYSVEHVRDTFRWVCCEIPNFTCSVITFLCVFRTGLRQWCFHSATPFVLCTQWTKITSFSHMD
jgi:hypothetical protein